MNSGQPKFICRLGYLAMFWLAVQSELTFAQSGADRIALDRAISESLKQLNDKARLLHNPPNNDPNSCYRMFQGGLLVARGMLAHRPELQSAIDSALAEAEKQPLNGERNLTLHRVIEKVRTELRSGASEPKPLPSTPLTPEKPPIQPLEKAVQPLPEKPVEKPVPPPAEIPLPTPKENPVVPPLVKPVEPPPESPKMPQPINPLPKVEAGPPPLESPMPTATLWKRMGGEAKMKQVVDNFIDLTKDDPKVNFTRGGKYPLDAAKLRDLKEKTLGYLSSVSDGTVAYTGRSMLEVHKGMNISQIELDQVFANLKLALESTNVPAATIDEFMKRVQARNQEFLPPAADKKDDKKP